MDLRNPDIYILRLKRQILNLSEHINNKIIKIRLEVYLVSLEKC